MEDRKKGMDKNAWINKIHGGNTIDWATIEHQTSFKKFKNNGVHFGQKVGMANINGGALIGSWSEKGSRNQAGSIMKTAFDEREKELWAISDGGSIWKGTLDGLNWTVVNDQLRFNKRFLEIVYPNNLSNSRRILASINGIPHYYDSSNGWQKADGINPNISSQEIKDQIAINGGRDIFFLATSSIFNTVELYHSNDYGASYSRIQTLDVNDLELASVGTYRAYNTFYLIEQKNSFASKLYKWNNSSKTLEIINNNVPVSFDTEHPANIEIIERSNRFWLYSYDKNNVLRRSTDGGSFWENLHIFQDRIFEGGLFISRQNPNLMMMCSENLHISKDAGATWNIANHWSEYYNNVINKLHADIMHVDEFKNGNQSFISISNHGGLSLSYNLAQDFVNIGLEDLNVSQYYSVRQHPIEQGFIMAGSQDQGIQRGFDFNEGTIQFTQTFSGDYGHLEFTNQGRSLWAVYPNGLIDYFSNPLSDNHPMETLDLPIKQKEILFPPIKAFKNQANAILVAGGSADANVEGNYIIIASVDDLGNMTARNLPTDFTIYGDGISAVETDPSNTSTFYAMTANGLFFKSTDIGKSFILKNNQLPIANDHYGHEILVSEKNSDLIVTGGSGYTDSPVNVSKDGGETFETMSTGLPPTTVFDMCYSNDEQLIFAATEAGPYVYFVKEDRWFDMSQGFAPNQTYWSVEYDKEQQKVRFGTFGRGIWDFDIALNTNVTEGPEETEVLKVYPNPVIDNLTIQTPYNGTVNILNTKGETVFSQTVNKLSSHNFQLGDFPNGVYYLIFDDGRNISSQILVKI